MGQMSNKMKKIIAGFVVALFIIITVLVTFAVVDSFSVMRKKYQILVFSENTDFGTVNDANGQYYAKDELVLIATIKDSPDGKVFFAGWYIGEEKISSDLIFNFVVPNKNTSIIAKFTLEQDEYFEVSFNHFGARGPNDVSIKFGEIINEPLTPERDGYNFVGWFFNEDLSEQVFFPIEIIKEITLYAKWEKKAYEIVWSIDNVNHSTQSEYESIPSIDVIPTKESTTQYDYEFIGWSPAIVPAKANAIYTAQFKEIIREYDITFIVEGVQSINKFKYGDIPLYSNTPIKTSDEQYSYTFIGWSPELQTVVKEATYTAEFTKVLNDYKLEFESNGGTPINSINKPYNTIINEPYQPTKVGYNFVGWFFNEDLSEQVFFPIEIIKEITLYAKWEKKAYEIVWSIDNVNHSTQSEYESIPSIDVIPTKESTTQYDYEFIGWSPAIVPAKANAIYTAQFKEIIREYDITFIVEGVQSINKFKYGDIPLYSNTPIKTSDEQYSYTFIGWSPELQTVVKEATYTAEFTKVLNDYKLEFESNGGTPINSINKPYNTIINEPYQPTKVGYNFIGWFKDEMLENEVLWPLQLKSNEKLFAKYELIQYDISFKYKDEMIISNIKYNIEETVTLPTNVEKDNYTFIGWHENKDFSGNNITILPAGTTGNKILYAKFKVNNDSRFLIKEFDHINNQLQAKVANAQEIIDFNAIVEVADGDTWLVSTDISANNIIYSNIGILELGNNVFYILVIDSSNEKSSTKVVVTRRMMFEIVYQANGGTEVVSHLAEEDSLLIEPQTIRNGYQFVNWDYDFTTPVTSDLLISASWKGLEYTITTNENEGTIVPDLSYTTQEVDQKVTLELPTRNGYTFSGWEISSDNASATLLSDTVLNIPTNSYGNINLTAIWEGKTYEITTNENEGTLVPDLSYTTQEVDQTITLEIPTRNGYTFGGWEISGDNVSVTLISNQELKIPTNSYGDITLTAKWEGNSYTITTNENEGTLVPDLSYTTQEVDQTITLEIPTRNGYTFGGWEISSDNASATLLSNETLNIPANSYGNITLTAKWEVIIYMVTTDENGGTTLIISANSYGNITLKDKWERRTYQIEINENGGSAVSNLTYKTGDEAQTVPLNIPIREGYTFDGWEISGEYVSEGTILVENAELTIPANTYGNIILDAKWIGNVYMITTDENGGSEVENPTYTVLGIDQEIDIIVPTKEGYIFVGWEISEEYNDLVSINSNTKILILANTYGEFVLTAQWLEE